ncbi:hypothetical protein M406DRAFT_250097 [Cryphonectria parasitica EP155]|uniref:PD-(D/E)XK nuclease-like domain-containing protein n=1 Tax=Cryphonectria parasitica (strain ATCC 38755 / EP155) TaxID=660469 RepID=A0A9P4Y9D7_CRYP1|nr:uncharacterized protein M406DRAFT_250097 [Cryphonectria parasitica EP155]KAF3768465.1 hypothetical protein M406DRAFT_250097 [Cryphonectria parasitica EP155]
MIDFSINLEPDPALLAAIDSALFVPTEYCPFGTNTINQTLHEPVRLCPAAVSIETKTDRAGLADADVKLAVWMAAWRSRMMPLVDWQLKMGPSARCITQLGITAVGETWKLYFLVDNGITLGAPRLRLLEYPEAIGCTRTVLGVYQLIAVLRHLCTWADRYFRDWVMDALGCQKQVAADK